MRKALPFLFYLLLILPYTGSAQPLCPSSEWLTSSMSWLIERSGANSAGFEAQYILDGTTACTNTGCRWVSPDGSPSGYAIFDLGKSLKIDGFRIYNNEQNSEQPKNLNLQYSSSATGPWTTLTSFTALECISCPPTGNGWEEFPAFAATEAR